MRKIDGDVAIVALRDGGARLRLTSKTGEIFALDMSAEQLATHAAAVNAIVGSTAPEPASLPPPSVDFGKLAKSAAKTKTGV